jgi:hypothetical protein
MDIKTGGKVFFLVKSGGKPIIDYQLVMSKK